MQKIQEMRSTPSLPSLPGLLWPAVVAPDRVLSMGEIEINSVLKLNWIVWNRTVLTSKQKNYTYFKLFEISFGVKWPEKSWDVVKQNINQPTNQPCLVIFQADLVHLNE